MQETVAGQRLLETGGNVFSGLRQMVRLFWPFLEQIPLNGWPYATLHGRPVPRLYSYSPLVIPKPADWDAHAHVTGYWFLDHSPDWQPHAALVDFLAAGPTTATRALATPCCRLAPNASR